MNNGTKVVYRIDSQDRIVFVNDVWQHFASENDAPDYAAEGVLNRSLWDFITDSTTRQFYQEVIKAARGEKPVTFNFRCDSAEYRRFMKMRVTGETGLVQFETETLAVEQRPPQPLLDRHSRRSGELVVICGWCKKINIGQAIWKEVEHAIEALRVFEQEKIPQLSHGMCHGCYVMVSEQLKNLCG
ncbi:MAG: hypothetical protein JSS81_14215 [Acidobacteria bacterium]|nr:hypothetical protein [Acidobacteriota bacterium]